MKILKNQVYWIVRNDYEVPFSDEWENIKAKCIKDTISFNKQVDKIFELMNAERPANHVVIIDTDDIAEVSYVKSHFISNNVINVKDKYNVERIKSQIEWIFGNYGKDIMKNADCNVFFCSDTHFLHANIIRYCNRPWNSGFNGNGEMLVSEDDVTRMNDDLISNWNSVVSKNDIVFHLGDFCLGKNQKDEIPKIRARLNGKINLVLGNHDHHNMKFYYDAGFDKVYDKPILWNNFFILSHAPIQWIRDGSVYANLFGHVHNQELYKHVTKNTYNCCVEMNDYRPVAFSDIMKKMENA